MPGVQLIRRYIAAALPSSDAPDSQRALGAAPRRSR